MERFYGPLCDAIKRLKARGQRKPRSGSANVKFLCSICSICFRTAQVVPDLRPVGAAGAAPHKHNFLCSTLARQAAHKPK